MREFITKGKEMPKRWLRAVMFGTLVCIFNWKLGMFIVAIVTLYLILGDDG